MRLPYSLLLSSLAASLGTDRSLRNKAPRLIGIDPDNPSAANPTTPSKSLRTPASAPEPPLIATHPELCDGQIPSDDCFKSMGTGGYLWLDKDSGCDELVGGDTPLGTTKKDFVNGGVWDAQTLAALSSRFPEPDSSKMGAVAGYYMGPDWPKYTDRIAGNFRRAYEFKTDKTSESTYITFSCKDTKNQCSRRVQGRSVGGYTWTYSGRFGYYHYITMCPSFFDTMSLHDLAAQVERDLADGDETKASSLAALSNRGQWMLREMMHARIVYKDEPKIIDEMVEGTDDPIPAYGPVFVHRLAETPPSRGGGATRSTTNADSYALVANANWWWNVTDYFPEAEPTEEAAPITLHVDLNNITDLRTANIEALLNAKLASSGTDDFDDEANMDGGVSTSRGVMAVEAEDAKTKKNQHLALASYINPTSDRATWDRMTGYPSNKISILVANVLNGPDSKVDPAWTGVINAAHRTGKTVIGYVRTGYLGVSHQKFKTMLGSGDLADWIAQIEADIETWYRLYPGKIGGIFLDEGWNKCGPNNIYADLYKFITDNTKRKHPKAFVVLNPGWSTPRCFEESADTLMTFEGNYTRYIDRTGRTYKSNGWTPKDNRKIWHIIYNVPQAKIKKVVALARKRGAGMLHITNATLPNPYDALPSDEYMRTLMKAVGVGGPMIAEPHPFPGGGSAPSAPAGLRVADADYTSVTLEWTTPAGSYAVAVYKGRTEVARILSSMSRVTIGFLPVGVKGHKFKTRAIGRDGSESKFSNTVSANTKPLPGGRSIINVKISASAAETIFEADVLVAYAFIRILVTEPDPKCTEPSYPINTPNGFVCAKYMIEGETSYRYNATGKDPKSGGWPWSWDPTTPVNDAGGNIEVKRDRYHYTWRLPIGTSTIDTNYIVVQGEGVSPRTEVFVPCPCSWEAKSSSAKTTTKDQQYCDGKRTSCP